MTAEDVLAKVRRDVEQANGGAPVTPAAAPVPDDTGHEPPTAHESAQGRPGAVLPLGREDLRRIVRDVVADFTRHPGPSVRERVTDALWPLLEHAQSAAAGSHEGVRLWMLDCGNLVQKHRERAEYWHKRWTAACERADEDGMQAIGQHVRIGELQERVEAAEAKLDRIAQVCREHLPRVAAEDVLRIIGGEEDPRA